MCPNIIIPLQIPIPSFSIRLFGIIVTGVTSPRRSKNRPKLLAIIRRVIVGLRMLSSKANELFSIIVDVFLCFFLFFLARFSWPEDAGWSLVCVFCQFNNFGWNSWYLFRKYLGTRLKRVLALFEGLVLEFFTENFFRNWSHYGSCEIVLIFAKFF